MAHRKSVQQIWHGRESGLVVPQGTVSDLSQSSSQTYLHIKEKALSLERLYQENNVSLPVTSDLARLIADAKTFSDSWLMGQVDRHRMTLLFRAGLLDRIADAVLPLAEVSDRARFLQALVSGSLNLLERKRSAAKDALWELERHRTARCRARARSGAPLNGVRTEGLRSQHEAVRPDPDRQLGRVAGLRKIPTTECCPCHRSRIGRGHRTRGSAHISS
jgi:hypothetical protein